MLDQLQNLVGVADLVKSRFPRLRGNEKKQQKRNDKGFKGGKRQGGNNDRRLKSADAPKRKSPSGFGTFLGNSLKD